MSFIKQLYKSLYSTKEIARYRFQKIGRTIVYIFLLSFLTIIPKSVHLHTIIKEEFTFIGESVKADIPDFTIAEGQLQTEKIEPLIKESDNFIFMFNPNETTIHNSPLQDSDGIFFLKDKVISNIQGQQEVVPYSSLDNITITKQDIVNFIQTAEKIYPIVLLIIIVVLFLSGSFTNFLGITILGLIGIFLAKEMNRNLNYKQTWTLSAYSITIPTIFFMIMDSLNTMVPQSFVIFTVVSMLILYLTIKEVPASKKLTK
ncbi:DUF1189 domain-containing protein [Bacillus sp. 165]|uniref:DUF1189 domain-containing protein n=1 Tax=Bacillus sp. 165 TaxID=1529117 RepID=UPI001ADB630B|nr:DUF1189 domain-containing protein [Bacillus sp. 165]MBO9129624.1 DUF1189 domain-containing protein [Bacillus sp. 165]